ncbi:PREDICTED: conserved oligomeric Golgi complex subunit 4-like [Camelina sativa]|uniref:Conserved oligomeric Golgi complex subunit 4-like n=1 Tax=Camelina sativa TaxID=90675 RepID=A0ABM0W8R2_CAMSA|nr:PREDICTED: conserved oligomeric Golgi complex subunit 4-like [Camelina sativa]
MAELEQDHGAEESLARDYVRSLTDAGMNIVESVAYIRSLDVGQDTLQQEETERESDQNLTQLQRSAAILDIVKAGAEQRMQVICLERVKTALVSEDYESAAKFVLKFLQIDSQSKDSNTELRAELLALKKQLEDIVKDKLVAAINEKIYPTIMRFVRLYTPLGMEEQGLKLYVGYLKNVIAMRGLTNYQQLVLSVEQDLEQVDFVGCLTDLFDDILMTIQYNDAILRALGGEDGVVYAICELQAVCDFRSSLIWQKYKDYRMLARFTNQNLPERPDPKVAELCVKEILLLMRLSKDYTELMFSKLRSVDPELLPRNTKAFRKGTFSKEIQDVTGLYVILENFYGILERFFMVESVRLAIRIDKQLPDSLITSMVGDVFYLLKTSLLRALSTSNIRSVLSVLSDAASLLANDYHDALQRKTRESHIDARLFVNDMVANNTGAENASTLNDIDVSCEYILKLNCEIEEQCSKVFAPAPADHERIKSCLSKLDELGNTFKQSACMDQLVAIVTQRIRPILETVATMSYELIETKHAQNADCSPWVKLLFDSVETNAASLKSRTISDNYESILDLIIEFIANRLEVIMMQKCFSQLGGLQLAQDTKALTSHFSDMTERFVRPKFARLNQMAGLLNSKKYLFVQEIMEFCSWNSVMTGTLTPGEILFVLSLRVEFKPEPTAAHLVL